MELNQLTKQLRNYWNKNNWQAPSNEWELKLTSLLKDSLILLKDVVDQSKPFFSFSPIQPEGREFIEKYGGEIIIKDHSKLSERGKNMQP